MDTHAAHPRTPPPPLHASLRTATTRTKEEVMRQWRTTDPGKSGADAGAPNAPPKMHRRVLGDFVITDKILGKGATAVVKEGYLYSNPTRKIAVKIITKSKLSEEKRQDLRDEVNTLLHLKPHPSIVHLLGIFQDRHYVYVVLEYVPCDLHTFLDQRGPLRESEAKRIFRQLVDALEHLHSSDIVHRDIKLENILIDETTYDIALCDFGFATFTKECKRLSKWCGSPYTVSPEIIKQQNYDGHAADIWSLGSVLYSLVCGIFPFQARSMFEVFERTQLGLFHPLPNHLSQEVQDLIAKLLTTDPRKRISLAATRAHPWLAEKEKKRCQVKEA